ncbi:MAG: BTAD domain-containing putative transcriptional regulator [Nocardioides sp.]
MSPGWTGCSPWLAGWRPRATLAPRWRRTTRRWDSGAASRWPTSPAPARLTAQAEQLAEQRISASEEWAVLARAAGHADRAVALLHPLVEAHPLREPLRALLMLALHDAGRTAEALTEYVRARQLLVAELGAEPGAVLRAAHAEVLRFEEPDTDEPRSPPVVTPAQLPAALTRLIGRGDSIAALDESLSSLADGPLTWVVSGPAGVGKSALAVQWTRGVAERFPDGQLFVGLRGFDPGGTPLSTTEALHSLLAGLGVPAEQTPQQLDALTGLYRSLLSGRRMLVLLDNARDAAQVAPLLPTSPGCLAVVTSRHELSALAVTHAARALPLALLDDAAARSLFAARLDERRLAAEPAAVGEILAHCGGLPLALAVSSARVATRADASLADLAAELGESSLDVLTLGHPTTDVRAVLSWSVDALSAEAARVFVLIGLHPGPEVGVAALASMAGGSLRESRAAVAELARANLVTVRRPGRIVLHDLVSAHAAELAETELTPEEREAARSRLVDHLLHSAVGATRTIFVTPLPFEPAPPTAGVTPETFADVEEGNDWLAAELSTLIQVTALAARSEAMHTRAWQLARTLNGYLWDRCRFADMVRLHELALAATQAAGDRAGEADTRHGLGEGLVGMEDFDQGGAELLCSLGLFGDLGDRVGESDVHCSLGRLFEAAGSPREALQHTEAALEIYREIGDRSGEAVALNNIGWLHGSLGDFETSLAYCRQSLELYRRHRDLTGQSYALDSVARAYLGLGDVRRAITMYAEAGEIARTLGHRYNHAENLTHLGDALHAVGDLDAARHAWAEALEVFTEVGHARAEAVRTRLQLVDDPTAR